jgi:nucleotide-binding universal stress UspA family protein
MTALAKILIPVDFSGRCVGAARYAEVLAARFGSEITLLHVLPPPHYEFSALEVGGSVLNELFATRNAQVRKELDAYLCDELGDFSLKRVLLEGDPARTIVEYAHSERTDLMIMPTHGYGPFRRFILGSVTTKVLHDADCPIWTGIHLEETLSAESILLRNILVAVDLGEQSKKTLLWGAWLAAAFGAKLSVLYAVPCLEGRGGEYFDADWRIHLTEESKKEIAKLQESAGTQAEVIIEGGDAPQAVCDAARRIGADVLVIGRGSAAGIFGRLRTNAYAIIRQSPCPVVSV